MKRFLAVVLALGLLVTAFAGCGNTGKTAEPASTAAVQPTESAAPAESATEPVPAKKDVTISYMLSQGWLEDSEKELGDKFAAETGIKVDYQVIPSAQYFNVLLTKLNAGECTDIFASQSGKFDIVSQLNIEKNAVDLTGAEWIQRMDPLVTEQVSANAKVYGLTIWDTSPSFPIVYNKKIFEKLGLSIPKTYEEFKNACTKILESGVTPIYEPVADGWHHVLWFPDIGPRFEEAEPGLVDKLNSNQTTFADSKIMEEALTQLQEMAKLGFFGKNYLSATGADTENNLGTGKYAMALSGLSTPARIHEAVPEANAEDFGYFEIPLADNQILCMQPSGPSRFIYSGSKYIEEAKAYFNYITKQENLQEYFIDKDDKKANLCFSGVKNELTEEMNTFLNSYEKKGTYLQIQVKYLNPQWMDIGKDLSAMFTGSMTPKDVLKSIDKRRADQAKAAKDPAWGN
jgi:raffinose/stachyose/melibiose transport system substrate-binding protein